MKCSASSLLVLAFLVPIVSPRVAAISEEEAIAGRLIARKYGDAVVGVKGTVLMRMKVGDRVMPPNEQKFDGNGTMITPSGLTVTSLNGIDPESTFDAMRARFNASSGGQSVELGKAEFKDLRLQLADGTEIPAKMAWKDAERDLVFLAPADGGVADKRTFTFINLNEAPGVGLDPGKLLPAVTGGRGLAAGDSGQTEHRDRRY